MSTSPLPEDGLKGLRNHWVSDLTSGFIVFLLALPLSLGIASASGFPPIMGLVTAIVGGLLGSLLTGSALAIKGPAAGLIVIVAGAVAEFGGGTIGWQLTLGVLVVSGLVQVAFSFLRWGRLVDAFPLAAVHGMLAAIGLIIIAKQTPVLLGTPSGLVAGKGPLDLLASIPTFFLQLDPSVALVGAISLAAVWIWPILPFKWTRVIPAPLVVLALAVPIGAALNLGPDRLVALGSFRDALGIHVDFGGIAAPWVFLKYLIMFALVGSLESLLTVKAVDALDPWKRTSDPNRDLFAIGISNTLAAVFGGLPMISEVARSSANAASGGVTRWSNFFHGVFLLVAALLAVPLLEMIPTAALAALLIGVGVRLAHPREWRSAWRIGPEQLAIFFTTVFFTLYEDLLIGIAAGMVVKLCVHLFRGASLRDLFSAQVALFPSGGTLRIEFHGVAAFTNVIGINRKLGHAREAIEREKTSTVLFDLIELRLIDHTAMVALDQFQKQLERSSIRVEWVGLENLISRSNHPRAARRKRRGQPSAAGELLSDESEGPDPGETLHRIAHILPAQPSLKDFVHHNTLHGYQHLEFFQGIFTAERQLDVRVVLALEDYRELHRTGRIHLRDIERAIRDRFGEVSVELYTDKMLHVPYPSRPPEGPPRLRDAWRSHYSMDLDSAVQPRLFRLVGAYLDQGVAIDPFPSDGSGFLDAVRRLEDLSAVSLFRSQRVRSLLQNAEVTLDDLLKLVVGRKAWFHTYLCEQQLGHRGFSGFVVTVEHSPGTLLDTRRISFEDWVFVELLFEIDALDSQIGPHWKPLSALNTSAPYDPLAESDLGEREEILSLWQCAFEGHFHDEVLAAIEVAPVHPVPPTPTLTAVFCIDDREDSLRRHVEDVEPTCVTYGAPGFFGIPIHFLPFGGKFMEKLAPVPATPRHLIRELDKGHRKGTVRYVDVRTHTPLRGLVSTLVFGGFSALRLGLDTLFPRRRPDHADAFGHMAIDGRLQLEASSPPEFQDDLQVGFTVEEMAGMVLGMLRSIGMLGPWSPFVFIVGHGSSSANNPHHAAYDCGACSGRPGGVNARIFAALANRPDVRRVLAAKGVALPDTTWFVGALHDTASDALRCYDEETIPVALRAEFDRVVQVFQTALARNAVERSRRFVTVDSSAVPERVREAVALRSSSYAEPRPELGHGSNALCMIGRRARFRSVFFDRRAFHASYDPLMDPDGNALKQVLAPLPVVCGGICLEYYFSRMDNSALGAGTKLSHHVIGLFGVSHSADGDLRPGLPLQMVEIHDPMRLLMVIEHTPEVIDRVLEDLPEQRAWFTRGWILLVAAPPQGGIYRFGMDGTWRPYNPDAHVAFTEFLQGAFEGTPSIATMRIEEATRENLPIQVLTPLN